MTKTDITLYFLQTSRAIRIAWLLEVLGLEYKLENYNRQSDGLASSEYKNAQHHVLGKSPAIKDGDFGVIESGAITEYICEKYDKEGLAIPKANPERTRVLEWIHASEGTYFLHSLAIVFLRRASASVENSKDVSEQLEKGFAENVQKDMRNLDSELEGRDYLVGDRLTAADINMHFNIQFTLDMHLGTQPGEFPNVDRWMKNLESLESYKKTVERTKYKSGAQAFKR